MKRVLAAALAAPLLAGCDMLGLSADAPPVEANQASAANQAAMAEPSANFPALTGRVVDEAGLLSGEEEELLSANLAALEGRTGDQLVIVTVPSLGGRTAADYGLALGNHWRVGETNGGRGVLIIVAPNERQVRIEVARGLETILTDTRAQEIVDTNLLPHLREGRWHRALTDGSVAVIETLIANETAPRGARP